MKIHCLETNNNKNNNPKKLIDVVNENDIRQCITTKYFSPTNYNGAKIKATCYATKKGSIAVLNTQCLTLDYLNELSVYENHERAALRLIELLKWYPCKVAVGTDANGDYQFIIMEGK